jgi:hypothetical protein
VGTLWAVGHVRLTMLLACATALVALSAPAVTLAGTYTWSQPGEFSGSANPDQKYGAASWSYNSGSPGSLTALSCSGGTCSGGGVSITQSGGQLVFTPPTVLGSVTLGWSDPLAAGQSVTVSGAISVGATCTWALADQNGTLTSGSALNTAISASDTLPAGGALYLTVTGSSLACTASLSSLTITAATPGVTLTSPANNSTFTTGEPEFSGSASTAFDASGTVTVRVYPGPSPSGAPVETLTTARSGGSYAAVPTAPLLNGEYTAQAEQDDPATPAGPNFSSPVTFVLDNVGPSLILNSFGSKPLLTATPIFTGAAGSRPQDNKSVALAIFPGSSISGSPVRAVTGTVGSNGRFSIQSPALDDGRYTALVGQLGDGLFGFSTPVTFRIKVHPPALTMLEPARGGSTSRSRVLFSGQAGDALGDSSTIVLSLYRGARAHGRAVGKRTVRANGGSWSLDWGHKLKNGLYTVRVVQTDDAGHTTRIAHTFLVVPGPTTIGGLVTLSSSDQVAVPIGCLASSGTCSGSVLVVTTRGFRTSPGGPFGPLRVLFAYVQIPAGKTETIRGSVPGSVAGLLRRNRGTPVRVTAALSMTGRASAIRSLKLGS